MRVLCLGARQSSHLASTIDFASVRRQALWVVVGQVLVAVGGALICYAIRGQLASVSALIGGGIGAAATLVQVGRRPAQ